MAITYATPPAPTTGLLTNPAGRWVKHVLRTVYRDGAAWRAILPTPDGHRLDTINPEHIPGPVVDSRQAARVTATSGGSHVYLLSGHPSESRLAVMDGAEVVRTSVAPLTTTNNDTSPIVLHRTPNGYLWAAVYAGGSVRVARSIDDGTSWQNAQTVLSVGGGATGLVGFASAGQTLVMVVMGNHGVGRHVRTISHDANTYTSGSWSTETLPGSSTSDNHLSVAPLWDGRILAVSKTSDTGAVPLLYSLLRDTEGEWTSQTFEIGPDAGVGYTRPSLTVAGSLGVVHYGHITTGVLHRRTMDLTADSPSWGGRDTVLTGPWDYSQSPATPAVVPTNDPWPMVVHDRHGGNMAVHWATEWAPRSVAVSGAAEVVSATHGWLARTAPLVGTTPATSHATGQVTARYALTGTAHATSGASGDVSIAAPLSGTAAVASSASGGVTVRAPVAGQSVGVVTVSGHTAALRPAAGVCTVVSGTSGNPQLPVGVSGAAAVVSGASGQPRARYAATGTAAAISGAAGQPGSRVQVAGTVPVVSSVSGSLSGDSQLAGVTAVTASTSGAVAARRTAAGGTVADATVWGAVTARLAAEGTATALVEVNAAGLTALRPASGTCVVISGSRDATPAGVSGVCAVIVTCRGTAGRLGEELPPPRHRVLTVAADLRTLTVAADYLRRTR